MPEPDWIDRWVAETGGGLDEGKRKFLREVARDHLVRDHADSLAVEGPADNPELVVYFRLRSRPDCRYGYRWPLRFSDSVGFWGAMYEIFDGARRVPRCDGPKDVVWVRTS